jgi:hypothetical protein
VVGEHIRLLGYDAALSGTTLDLSLYWESLGRPERDYTTFVHLRDEQGQIVSQRDHPPAGGKYPTSLWETDEVIRDEIELPLPPDFASGGYQLVVGLYNSATGKKLAIPGTVDNALILFEESFR